MLPAVPRRENLFCGHTEKVEPVDKEDMPPETFRDAAKNHYPQTQNSKKKENRFSKKTPLERYGDVGYDKCGG
jgi:hypothetical protein